jgi:hypothetical protein
MAARLVLQVRLGRHHRPTGKTRHTIGGRDIPPTATLRIVQYAGNTGYYLLHLDKDGRETTDTWHETLDAAMAQAKWEFQVQREDWNSAEN